MISRLNHRQLPEAKAIMAAWLNSDDPAHWKLAEKYLVTEGVVRGRLSMDVEEADIILRKKRLGLLPMVFHWTAKNHDSEIIHTLHQTARNQLITQLPKSNELQKKILNGSPEQGISPLLQTVNVAGKAVARVDGKGTKLSLVKALHEAGALPPNFEITYANNLSLPYSSPDQLTYSTVPQWILSTKQTSLYPFLMTLRQGLDAKSSPTREKITKQIIEAMTHTDPSDCEALRKAAHGSLVRVLPELYPHTGTKPKKYTSLILNLGDAADLELSRALLKYESPYNLRDVQVVRYTGRQSQEEQKTDTPHYKVGYPLENFVADKSSQRIEDLLAEPSFRRAPKGGGFWRADILLDRAIYPPTPDQIWDPCRHLPDLTKKAKQGE